MFSNFRSTLLGFCLEKEYYGCYYPPLASKKIIGFFSRFDNWSRNNKLPGYGFYFLIARKLMFGATPIKNNNLLRIPDMLPVSIANKNRFKKYRSLK